MAVLAATGGWIAASSCTMTNVGLTRKCTTSPPPSPPQLARAKLRTGFHPHG
jgi:hypothetical protein